eukprot:10054993-Heterocapsa_arctica.AAC.1
MNSKLFGHGLAHPILSYVVNNVCPICRTTFADRVVASHHLAAAYTTGRCVAGLSTFTWDEAPATLCCHSC